jgi:peptidoglycan/LPS O-acetylase OafA/YrhL
MTATSLATGAAKAETPPKSRRIPSLDGLRAISIMLVLLAHLCGTRGFPIPAINGVWFLGALGVQVFFVISGYLITGLLIAEAAKTGTVSIRDFYIRRSLRIFPAAYAFVVCLCLFWGLRGADLIAASTYTSNYLPTRRWESGHLWSLAVEEQFYLLWPAAFIALRHRAATVLAAFALMAPVLRFLLFWLIPEYRPYIGSSFETVADSLATGCLLAIMRKDLHANEVYRRVLGSRLPLLLVAAALAACIALRNISTTVSVALSATLLNPALAVLIDQAVTHPPQWLNNRAMVTVGVGSYSLYLWQQPFLNRTSSEWWTAWPVNILLVLALAYISYQCIEKPFQRLRGRFRGASHSPA